MTKRGNVCLSGGTVKCVGPLVSMLKKIKGVTQGSMCNLLWTHGMFLSVFNLSKAGNMLNITGYITLLRKESLY